MIDTTLTKIYIDPNTETYAFSEHIFQLRYE